MNIKKLAHSDLFSNIIVAAIIINALLIGVQTLTDNVIVNTVQHLMLGIFIAEIFIRWFGRKSTKSYLENYWNWFDITIVLIALIPPSIFSDGPALSTLRVIRVFRVIRIFKAFPDLQLVIRVLLVSFKSVYYTCFLLLIFMYIYSVIGVTLFKGVTTVVTAYVDDLDPFGNIFEAFFSLFRVTTGEDWTDLRYDLMAGTSKLLVDGYFLSWYILSAFLLVNIVFGAIINNYEVIYGQEQKTAEYNEKQRLVEKINLIESKIDQLLEAQSQSENSHKSSRATTKD